MAIYISKNRFENSELVITFEYHIIFISKSSDNMPLLCYVKPIFRDISLCPSSS